MEGGSRLREIIGENRARIEALEAELRRARDKLHVLEAERASVVLLTERVSELSQQMIRVTRRMDESLKRPTTGGIGNLIALCSLVVAVVALVIVAMR